MRPLLRRRLNDICAPALTVLLGVLMGTLGYYSASPFPLYLALLAVGFILGFGFSMAGVRWPHLVALAYPAVVAVTIVAISRLTAHDSAFLMLPNSLVAIFTFVALPTLLGSALGGIIRGAPTSNERGARSGS